MARLRLALFCRIDRRGDREGEAIGRLARGGAILYAAATGGIRRCTIFGSGLEQAEMRAAGQWVIPTGGGYFFVPAISALRDVIAR